MSAETNKQENFDKQIIDFTERHPHYVTLGCRRYYKRALIGYVILAIATVIGIWSVTNHSDKHLRKDINTLGVTSCIRSIPTLNKFNDFIDSAIDTRRQQYRLAKKQGNTALAKIQLRAIKRYERDKLPIPTKAQCQKPIIKG